MSTIPIGGGRPTGPLTPASGAVAAVPLSGATPALRITPARPDGVPDALATAANPLLRYEALNREINTGYARFAQIFQGIVDPELAPGARSAVRPVWFA